MNRLLLPISQIINNLKHKGYQGSIKRELIILVNTDDITSELLGIKNMSSLCLLYNRYKKIN
ncbi:MAG TPA: hypothetical protein PLW93_04730 [Candidatus Absconditabacterales bacterium]|nr:hypothetical protein [Candidatus Absconditabacterales bacterium]